MELNHLPNEVTLSKEHVQPISKWLLGHVTCAWSFLRKVHFLPDTGMDPAVINDPSLWFQDVQASNNVYLLVEHNLWTCQPIETQ